MFGDMGKMMKQVTEMKRKMGEVEKELKKTIIAGQSKDGTIVVSINGKMKLEKVDVKSGFPTDAKALENAIKEAVDSSLTQVSDLAQAKLKGVTGGINIPGLT